MGVRCEVFLEIESRSNQTGCLLNSREVALPTSELSFGGKIPGWAEQNNFKKL